MTAARTGAIGRLAAAAALLCACLAPAALAQDSPAPKPAAASAAGASVATASPPESQSIRQGAGATTRDSTDLDHSREGAGAADNRGFQAPFSSSKGPINIKSDSLSLDYKNKIIVWTGNVHAVQSGSDLICDVMHVYYGVDFNDIKSVIADHNVKITQGGRWATSDHAVLDQTARIITMTGNPVIHDGPDQITGSKVLVYLDTQKSVVEGAHAVIFPHKDKTRDNNQASGPDDHSAGQKD